ncbi:MAG TPA: hypothetical protein DSN98_02695 [Thermoplasmata archaeon]|jgi:hypothetical protein|nr:MAG TPA: hypothetical protein DSN98_02695 [Thermoplasmata archaeon]
MKIYSTYKIVAVSIVLLLCGINFIPMSTSQTIKRYDEPSQKTILDGQILFAPMDSGITYLIDNAGEVTHTWQSNYFPGESAYLLDDGTLLRTIKLSFIYGGDGGGVQKINWTGSLIWDYRYYTDNYLSHHDIHPLPNGNVLMIAWEFKSRVEAVTAGRNPDRLVGNTLMPDHIVEVKPTGPTSGDIVWVWHVWDHLVQDYDHTKDNYGVVGDHPELIDINYGYTTADWLHTNSIDYNVEFDQILLSVRNFNEIWVIDHSTTTEEAAGHIGGNGGKGGDLLYRWGNPQAYHAGNAADEKFFAQHDASWVETGYPGAGNILVFNNAGGRIGLVHTTIDEITPPVDSSGTYDLESGSAYDPAVQTWIYDSDFYAFIIGGVTRLPNGNTLICNGPLGRFFEVTPDGTTVWEYLNSYPSPAMNNVFKIQYIPPEEPPNPDVPNLNCEGSLSWTKVHGGKTVDGSFQIENIGGVDSLLHWRVNVSTIDWGTWSFTPEFGENLTPLDGKITVQVSVRAPDEKNSEFQGYIRVENTDNPNDFDVIPVILKTPMNVLSLQEMIHSFFIKHKLQYLFFEKLWNVYLKLKNVSNNPIL